MCPSAATPCRAGRPVPRSAAGSCHQALVLRAHPATGSSSALRACSQPPSFSSSAVISRVWSKWRIVGSEGGSWPSAVPRQRSIVGGRRLTHSPMAVGRCAPLITAQRMIEMSERWLWRSPRLARGRSKRTEAREERRGVRPDGSGAHTRAPPSSPYQDLGGERQSPARGAPRIRSARRPHQSTWVERARPAIGGPSPESWRPRRRLVRRR